MKFPRNPNRPLLPERYEIFMELHESIRDLNDLYNELGRVELLNVLNLQKKILAMFEEQEAEYRKEELEEAYRYIHLLPHAVRTWLLDYRDKEMEL